MSVPIPFQVVVEHEDKPTIFATRPLEARSDGFEKAVLLSGNGVKLMEGFTPLIK
jgi:hypothetical protein